MTEVPTKLDEISLAIGELKSDTKSLDRTLTQHCDDDDRRHQENLDAIRDLTKALEPLGPLAATVATMKPIVESYQTSRLKLAGAISLAMVLLGFVGWVIEQIIASGVRWIFPPH